MKNKWVIIILILILALAAFLRLYQIADYMTFLGDEGRDVIIAKDILQGHFTLLGPRASAGDFYTGPIYYYMMAPFLWLFHNDPVGPAVMVALFGVATVLLLFFVGKDFFNKQTGLIAAALYAVSPLVITYSHSSWNPNTVPFFSLLTMYLLYKGATTVHSPWKYYFFTGILLGIDIQLHYISLFLAVAVAVGLFGMNWYTNHKPQFLQLIKYYLLILIGFLIGFAPFLAFEFRHGFPNLRKIAAFITTDTGRSTGYETYHAFYQPIADVFFRTFARLVFSFPQPSFYVNFTLLQLQLWGLAILICAVAAIILLILHKNKFVVILLSIWLIFGVVLFGLYKKPIYDYYLVFLFPLPFLLIGNLIARIMDLRRGKYVYGIALGISFFLVIFISNLFYNPFRAEPNKQKDQVESISAFVISKTDNKPFNFALLTPGNSDQGYRYFMDDLGHKPVAIDLPSTDIARKTVTDQLLIVCEDLNCKPLGNPLFEVAGFGPAVIVGEWSYSHVKVYKLVHPTPTPTN